MSTIFSKIINRELPATIVYEDDQCLAFEDIAPKAPVHVLVIPKVTTLATLNDASQADAALLGHMMLVAAGIARERGVADSGWRLVCNVNDDGGQEVYHLHLHILGGKKLGAIPS